MTRSQALRHERQGAFGGLQNGHFWRLAAIRHHHVPGRTARRTWLRVQRSAAMWVYLWVAPASGESPCDINCDPRSGRPPIACPLAVSIDKYWDFAVFFNLCARMLCAHAQFSRPPGLPLACFPTLENGLTL